MTIDLSLRRDYAEITRLHVEDGYNLSEIAEMYGCTRERVRQIVLEQHGRTLTRERWAEARRERERVAVEISAAYRARVEENKQSHGTRTSYGRGCSCEECRAANRDYMKSLQGKEPPQHGTVSAYTNYGCRCDRCKEAGSWNNRVQRRRRGSTLSVHGRELAGHGTETMYANGGCRCNACRDATRLARERRKATA